MIVIYNNIIVFWMWKISLIVKSISIVCILNNLVSKKLMDKNIVRCMCCWFIIMLKYIYEMFIF